jgi:hypothetical protein
MQNDRLAFFLASKGTNHNISFNVYPYIDRESNGNDSIQALGVWTNNNEMANKTIQYDDDECI